MGDHKALIEANLAALDDQDVAIFSFPRSGNTWLRLCLADLVLQLRGDATDTDLPVDLGLVVPALAKSAVTPALRSLPGGGRLFKTHERREVGDRRFVYVVRDPLDTLRSYYRFHSRGRGDWSDVDAFCRVQAARWVEHVTTALDLRSPERAVFVSYENLHADGPRTIGQVCEFLGLKVSSPMTERAIDHHRVDKRRNLAYELGHPSASYNFGDGQIGLGKSSLPVETVAFVTELTAAIRARACEAVDEGRR